MVQAYCMKCRSKREMKDTPSEVEIKYRNLLLACSPSERLAMAGRMFGTAKALVEAGIRQQHGELPPAELRRHLFLRFYGQDFSETEKKRILDSLLA